MVTAVVGAGGKTTLIHALTARHRAAGRSVLVTTTTHMRREPGMLLNPTPEQLTAALKTAGYAAAGVPAAEGKIGPLPREVYLAGCAAADEVLVEADGARGRFVKLPAPHEPVIPACAGQTVDVVGADGFGRPIAEVCHRPERYAAICGAALTDIVTPAMAAQVLLAEGYGGGWVYVNKVETPRDRANAAALAAALPGTVVAGSLHRREYQVY